MIAGHPPLEPDAPIIVIDIGNTNIAVATWVKGEVRTPLSCPTDDQNAFNEAFDAHAEACQDGHASAVVLASVVPEALERIRANLAALLDKEALVVGETIPLPIDLSVTDAQRVGADRVCAAAAAYDKIETGCIVVDFGTATTVDLIDDEGTMVGGAILPGLDLQFRSLHEYTAVLPMVERGTPDQPYGRSTVEAIQTGVCRGLAGAVRALVEGYASSLNRWPQVVATGGDAAFMAPYCDYIDVLVAHLTLQGIGLAYRQHLETMGV